jgi:Zn-dependent M28 family amino/carboxypeptidase
MHLLRVGTLLGLTAVSACASPQQTPADRTQGTAVVASGIDHAQLITDIRVLSADSMEGRRTGTPGNERARAYLLERFAEIGMAPLGDSFEHRFRFVPRGETAELDGVNLVGYVRGTSHPDRYLVVTAHYDHLGIRNGEIYSGADDNASGTAGLLALARHFIDEPPAHSVIFLATDAEEMGLQGARAFVAAPPVPREALRFNVNMDMISRNERDELYAAGTYHRPWLVPLIERIAAAAPVTLLMGHDRPDLPPGDDWTHASDHGPFHDAGIPFLYFGVQDHPDYHRPTDVFENIDPDFFGRAVETVRRAVREIDEELEE